MIKIQPQIYKSLYEVQENCISAFQPLVIAKPKFDRDTFSRNFATVAPQKRNFIHKFANLSEHYKLLYDVFDLNILKNFSKEKLKSLFLIASLKDETGMLRYSPTELIHTAMLDKKTFDFITPFARQKNSSGIFNFSFNDLKILSKFSEKERQNAMQLFSFKIPSEDLINISKDKNANITALTQRLSVIEHLYPQQISEIGVKKHQNNYIVHFLTSDDHKTHHFVFDNNFNLNPAYKSNIDFEKGELKKNSFLERFRIRNKKIQKSPYIDDSKKISLANHFQAIGKIIEQGDYLKSMGQKMYSHNYNTLVTGEGNLIETEIKFPKNMLVNYWKKGLISNSDLINICTDYAELIPKSDIDYFALNNIKMTLFDTEKIIEIRKNNALSKPVEIGSEYYKKILDEALKTAKETLKNIKSEKQMIIIDGLPGAGKSTLINSLLKNDNKAFYTPDSDDIKGMFKEIYKNGEGADLVHKASGKILKSEIIPRVLEQGKNLIFQTTGDYISINKIIKLATKYGYKIDFIQIPTSKSTSLERTIQRFNDNGRFLDPIVTMSIFNTNNKEKLYSAKIFSYNPNISDTYILQNGKLHCIKDGCFTEKYKRL